MQPNTQLITSKLFPEKKNFTIWTFHNLIDCKPILPDLSTESILVHTLSRVVCEKKEGEGRLNNINVPKIITN